MILQDLINGPLGILFVIYTARLLPPAVGYRLAEIIAHNIAKQKEFPMVRAVRSNLWVVSDCSAGPEELTTLTEKVFIQQARSLYEYFHYFKNQADTDKKIILDESFLQVIEHSRRRDKAQFLLTPHYSNFDLSSNAAANRGLSMQVLSYSNPSLSYRWHNKYRNVNGIDVTPISTSSLHTALENLKNGGSVFTMVDRPYGNSSLRPQFFGRRSVLPTGYIRLAIKTDVPIRVIFCIPSPQGKYTLSASDPIPILRDNDPVQEQLLNIHQVLSVIESLIKRDPVHWSMFYPVWPELLPDTP